MSAASLSRRPAEVISGRSASVWAKVLVAVNVKSVPVSLCRPIFVSAPPSWR